MSDARQRILARLRDNRPQSATPPPDYSKPLGWGSERRIASFTERMQAVRGEVHRRPRDAWPAWLNRELPARGMNRVLLGAGDVTVIAGPVTRAIEARR